MTIKRMKQNLRSRTLRLISIVILMIILGGGCVKNDRIIEEKPTLSPTITASPTLIVTPSPTISPAPTQVVKRWIPMNQEKTLYRLPLDSRIEETGGIMCFYEWYGDLLVVNSLGDGINFYVCDIYNGRIKDSISMKATVTDLGSAEVTNDGEYRFYDSNSREFIYINQQLEIVDRIKVLVESEILPYITQDKSTVYYIRYLDHEGMELVKNTLATGEETVLANKFKGYDYGIISGLLFNDRVMLVCGYSKVTDYFYIDLEKFEVYDQEETVYLRLQSKGEMFGGMTSNSLPELIFGYSSKMEETYCITYEDPSECYSGTFFLEEKRLATYYSKSNKDGTLYDYYFRFYDLETGHIAKMTSYMEVNGNGYVNEPKVYMKDAQVLVGDVLDHQHNCIYLWDLSAAANQSDLVNSYIFEYHNSDTPDYEMLEQLQSRADEIGLKFGVSIVTGMNCKSDLVDYEATLNYEVRLIRETLDVIERVLAEYPSDFFHQIGRYGEDTLVIYLVGELTSMNENAVSHAAALYNGYGNEQYVAVDCRQYYSLKQNLYHELSHAIDTYLVEHGDFYDYGKSWSILNPEGFDYEYTYREDNEISYDYCYWSANPEEVYFIDTYAKTFPTEDRARLMEYALRDGIVTYEDCPHLIAKLEVMYDEIVECFDTSNWNGDFFEFDDVFGDPE